MSDITKVKDSYFPTVNITHKPRRLQADNLINSGRMTEEDKEDSPDVMSSVPLHSITLERAIEYYELNAVGEFATLYRSTAKWLRQLLLVGYKSALKELNEVLGDTSTQNEVTENEEEKNEIQEGS